MSSAAQYVVAAYAGMWFGLMMYIVVIGLRTARMARQVELLSRLVEGETARDDPPSEGT